MEDKVRLRRQASNPTTSNSLCVLLARCGSANMNSKLLEFIRIIRSPTCFLDTGYSLDAR